MVARVQLAIKAGLRTYALPILGSLFYRFLFGRRSALSARLGNRIAAWEQGRGDVPVDALVWDNEYRRDRWEFLRGIGELPRYSIIGGYVRYLRPGAAVLDIGCGSGILAAWLKGHYRRYLGIDVSSAAIERARAEAADDNTEFRQGDAETDVPTERFDVIAFNESLYYFRDPFTGFERYRAQLAPDGIIIVSMYRGSYRATSILRRLQRRYAVVDTARAGHGPHAWECSVFSGVQRSGPAPPSTLRKN
jgi:SAM-dependent methyltransferase